MSLSQSCGLPLVLKTLLYILRLEAVIASLVTFRIFAMFDGEIPNLMSKHILYSCRDTLRKKTDKKSKK